MIKETLRWLIFVALVLGVFVIFGGCSTKPPSTTSFVIDIYPTEEGFFIVTERGSDDSLAIKFNAEILRTDEPIEIKP